MRVSVRKELLMAFIVSPIPLPAILDGSQLDTYDLAFATLATVAKIDSVSALVT